MKCIFINMPDIPFTPKIMLEEPLDIIYMMEYIKNMVSHNHILKFIDMNALKINVIDEIENEIMDSHLVVLFINYFSTFHTNEAVNMCEKHIADIHKLNANLKIFVVTRLNLSIHNNYTSVLYNHVEYTIINFLEPFQRISNIIHRLSRSKSTDF